MSQLKMGPGCHNAVLIELNVWNHWNDWNKWNRGRWMQGAAKWNVWNVLNGALWNMARDSTGRLNELNCLKLRWLWGTEERPKVLEPASLVKEVKDDPGKAVKSYAKP